MIEEAMKKFWSKDKTPRNNFEVKPITNNGKHDWARWIALLQKDIHIPNLSENYIYLIQERACKGCNFKELNVQKYQIN